MKKSILNCLLFMVLAVMMLVPMSVSASAEAEDIQVIRPYIAGAEVVGTELTGNYTYYDYDNKHGENGTTFQWLCSDEKNGVYTNIKGATGSKYVLKAEDSGKYLKFKVTPKSGANIGNASESWMIGPVLTQEEAGTINNYFKSSDNYVTNVNTIQSKIQERLANAVYFTIDTKGNVNEGKLYGSEFLYKNNFKFPFKDATKPMVKDNKAYAPAAFFLEYLDAEVPSTVPYVMVDSIKYYNLKDGAAALGKKVWNGDENQSDVKNFQLQHLGQGLVVISDQENIFDPVADRDLIDEACNELYTLRSTEEQMEWWRAAKYGMFLHWDPSSIRGVEISWDRQAMRPRDVDANVFSNAIDKVYDTQYKSFNPTEYNPDEWMALAKEAGVKYIVLTTKHHGSFSNFNSQFDNYTIANTPYGAGGKEIVKQYVDAARKAGLKIGFYYSARDWYNPNYLTADHHRYLEYYFGQMQELLTNYGKIDIMWFDSIGENSLNQWDARTLLRRMKQLQPNVIVNNRYMAELANYDKAPYDINGDWYTPEHRLGGFDSSRPWESCMTVTEAPGGGWSYRPEGRLKTVEESVKYLINNVVNDGNLLYNIGPMPNGKLNSAHAQVFKDVGAWLKQYEEAVYNTRGGPYVNPSWGGSTFRKNDNGTETIYLHVSPLLKNSKPTGGLQIEVPSNGQVYNSAALVKEGTELDGKSVNLVKNDKGYLLTLPEGVQWDEYDTVIKLEADVKATLLNKIAEAKQFAEKMSAEILGNVKGTLLELTADAEAVAGLPGSSTETLSEHLTIINHEIALAESAIQLNHLMNSSTEKLNEVAVGEEKWECPQILFDKLQQSFNTAKDCLRDAAVTKAQLQDAISEINLLLGSLDSIMSSLKITFTPGRSDGQGTYTMTSGFKELKIRYTLDKSEPTKDSALYDGKALPIFGQMLSIKAALFDGAGKRVSSTCEQNYFNASNQNNIAAADTTVTASGVYGDNPSYNGAKACDDNKGTRWATPDGTITATLEVVFGAEKTVNTALIQEYLGSGETSRISSYAIEYWDAKTETWKEAMNGTQAGESKAVTFEPVTSTKVRLNIKGCMNVTIYEFGLYNLEDSAAIVKDSDTLYPNGAIQLGMEGLRADGSVISQDKIKNITYYTDREDLISISSAGKLRLKEGVVLTKDETVKVWAAGTVNGQEKTTEKQNITLSQSGKNLALNQKTSASSVYGNMAGYNAEKATDGNQMTRWAAATGQPEYWLEVEFNKPTTFGCVKFKVYSDKGDAKNLEILKSFMIQTWDGEKWVNAYDSKITAPGITYPVYDGTEEYKDPGAWVDSKGGIKSTDYIVNFEGVTAEKIRLYSNDCVKEPSIFDFSVYDTQSTVVLPDIEKVGETGDIEVPYGTAYEGLGLPEKVTVTLDDDTIRELNVNWQRGDYDGNKADSYALEGDIVIDNTITNTKNLKVQINVIVNEKDVVLDKKPLEAKIAEAKAILPDGFTKESYEALQLEIGKAEAALNTVTTQKQITVAVQNLQNAIDDLEKIIEPQIKEIETAAPLTGRKVELGTKFEDLKLPDEIAVTFTDKSTDTLPVQWSSEGYIGEAVGEYTLTGEIAIDEKTMSNSNGITASIVITVVNEIPVDPTFDTKGLEAAIQKAEAIQTGIYTSKSYQVLKDSIFSAKAVLENPVTQEAIDTAAASLEARIKELVKIPEVIRVAALSPLKVPYGTSFEKVVLPNRVALTLSDGTQAFAAIDWSAGNYSGAKAGTYTLPGSLRISGEVKNSSGMRAVIKVTVEKEIIKVVKPSKVTLNYSNITMKKGTRFTWLKPVVSPKSATNKKVTWTTSNKKVATVDKKGVIKAKGIGNAKITVKTVNNKTKVVKVRVVNKNIEVSKVTLRKNITVIKGKKVKLLATVSPINAASKKVTWVSSDSKKASVSSKGTITAKKSGKVKITCRAKDGSGKKAVCTVTIKAK